jgi:hypothetical protein
MIRVQGPDGFSIEFPADTSQDVIRNVMSQRYGAPEAKQDPAMALPSDTSLAADPIRAQVDRERAETLFNNPALFERQKMGIARRIMQGPTMGLADEVIAGFSAPFEMIKRGTFNPIRGYEFAKAQEDAAYDEAKERQGILGTAAEIGGGIVGGTAIAKGLQAAPAAVTKAGQIAQSILGGLRGSGNIGTRLGTAAGGGALYGGLSGIGEGRGVEDRLAKGATGAFVGGALGGALQGVAEVAKPTLGWVSASMDPKGFAQRQLARGISESGRDVRDIIRDVADARAAGQPFTVADAMGNAGQRQLSVVARNPGEGRTRAVDFLEGRQSGQGRRIANILSEGLDATKSAAQARTEMEAARKAGADINYGAARGAAGTINPSKAIAAADNFLAPGQSGNIIQSPLPDDSVEAVVRQFRSRMTDGKNVLTDFNAAHRLKIDLDTAIDGARGQAQGILKQMRNNLDDALADASVPYAAARDDFAKRSKAIDAIDEGRNMSMRGRTEDTIPKFQAMNPDQQAAARIGYADPIIERMQGGPAGVNKAREFTSDAAQAELPAFAVSGRADPMMRGLGRENTMFETMAQALRGSRTADNLSDNAAMGVSPEIFSNLLSGNVPAALKNMIVRSADTLGGNTAKVRDELSRYLLMTGNAQNLPADLAKAIATKAKRDELANRILRGAYAGTGSATSQAQGQARTK